MYSELVSSNTCGVAGVAVESRRMCGAAAMDGFRGVGVDGPLSVLGCMSSVLRREDRDTLYGDAPSWRHCAVATGSLDAGGGRPCLKARYALNQKVSTVNYSATIRQWRNT